MFTFSSALSFLLLLLFCSSTPTSVNKKKPANKKSPDLLSELYLYLIKNQPSFVQLTNSKRHDGIGKIGGNNIAA